ncbi:MAG: serine/threonine protein kinase [Myxococcales bacterium]|nr:serine/threonine protein kinase [Myxococcales bacterium]
MTDLASLTSARLPGGWSGLSLLATGDASAVYRATRVVDGAVIALKVLHDDGDPPPRLPRVAAHAGLVTLHGAGRVGGAAYVTMALVPGAPVDAVVARGPLAPAAALPIVAQLADALVHLHAHGVVHGAVEPDHVLVDGGRACLISLDGAPARSAPHQPRHVCRGRGAFVSGRPSYQAPERLRGLAIDHRADVYGLGLVAYTLLTGVDAFAADALMTTIVQAVRGPPLTLPPALAADARLAAWFAQAVARDPAARFPTAAALRAALPSSP